MRSKPKFYSGGIFRRQFFALFGTAAVFFIATTLAIVLGTEKAIIARQLVLTSAYRDELRSRLSDWLSERVDDVQFFARDLAFEGAEALQPVHAQARLNLFSEVETVFSDSAIAAPDGRVLASTAGSASPGGNMADRDYFQAAAAGRNAVSGFLRGRKTGAAVIALAAPVLPGVKGSAVVVGYLRLETLAALIDEVQFGDQGKAYLVDLDGHPITSDILRRYKQLGADAFGAPVRNMAVDSLRAGHDGFGQYVGLDGTPVIGAYARLAPLDLGLVVELSRSRAVSPIDSLLASSLLFFATMLVLIVAVAAFLSLRLVAPIRLLIGAIEGVIGEREFEAIEVRTGTELDRLIELFNRMVSTIRTREDGLKDSAARDSLTGLYNHARIEEFLELEIRRKRRSGEKVAFVMLDIDHFKQVNDTFGHLAGDEVLRGISRILEDAVRGGDIAGRYGGEEFSIILDARSEEEVAAFCERIRRRVEEKEFESEGTKVTVTVSLGWTRTLAEGLAPYDFVRNADRALYRAKEAGRNRVVGQGGKDDWPGGS